MKPVSLTQLFILSFVIIFVAPVIIVSSLQQQRVNEFSVGQIIDQLGRIADKKVEAIENYCSNLTEQTETRSRSRYTLDTFGQLLELYQNGKAKSAEFKSISKLYSTDFDNTTGNSISNLFFITPQGEIFFSTKPELVNKNLRIATRQNAQLSAAFNQANKLLETSITDFLNYPTRKEESVYVATPVFSAGVYIGVLALQAELNKSRKVFLNDSNLGQSNETVIVRHGDRGYLYTFSPNKESQPIRTSQSMDRISEALKNSLEAERGGGIVTDEQDNSVVAVWRFIPSLQWGMAITVDADAALLPVKNIEHSGHIALILMIIFGMTFLVLLGRKIVNPIKQITSGAHALSQGVNQQVPENTGFAEARGLASSFNKMANLIIEHQTQLEKRVLQRTEQLRERSDRLLAEIGFRLEIEKKLRRAHTIIEATSEAIFITNLIPEVIDVNPAYCQLLGYDEAELLDKPLHSLINDQQHETTYEEIWKAVVENGHWHGEVLQRHRHGDVIPALMTINSVFDDSGKLMNYVGIVTDIAQLKKTEKELEHLAYYDVLTGLPNRMLFYDRLNHEISWAKREQRRIALLFLDLDGFKYVNDSLGHDEGDLLLRVVSSRLTSTVRQNDTVSRLGGDEFTVVVTDIKTEHDAARIANELIKQLAEPVVLAGQEVFIGASIGISLYPDDGTSSELLVKHADAAMYEAKEMGKATFQFYSHDLGEKNASHLQMESELRRALTNDEMFLLYQPQIKLESGELVGIEALIRWNHPTRGLVSPAEFIPLAEESRLIMEIDQWVIKTACRQLTLWNQNTGTRLSLSINLSALQFQNKALLKFIKSVIEENAIAAGQIELEITEGTLIQKKDESEVIMRNLSKLGVRIAIDDFGTGYSSLSYLKKYPISLLKIDRTFIQDIPDEQVDRAITASIISFAQGLGIRTLAEGVENENQHDFLKQNHCDYAQGYLYSYPVPASDIETLISGNQPLHRIS